jgi:hypothetical protein
VCVVFFHAQGWAVDRLVFLLEVDSLLSLFSLHCRLLVLVLTQHPRKWLVLLLLQDLKPSTQSQTEVASLVQQLQAVLTKLQFADLALRQHLP